MPRYEYRCRSCGATFERNRPMAESTVPAPCPDGHTDTVKLLSTVSLTGRGGAGSAGGGQPSVGMGGGGCCGGSCGC